MGDEATNDARDAIKSRKNIYFILFKTEKEKEILFEKIFNSFLEKNKDKNYICDFKNKFITLQFKNSIIKGHFLWMSNKTINHNQTSLESSYTLNATKLIKSITKIPYCDFYTEFKNSIDTHYNFRPREIKILKKHCDILLDKYKCH